jgi:copper chaperone for superoxide dismutase/copper chaperone
VRGASSADASVPSQAAVVILESPVPVPTLAGEAGGVSRALYGMNEAEHSQKVFGIARLVQIAPKSILLDLTVRLPPASRVPFAVYVSAAGNIVDPPATTGRKYVDLGVVTPDKDGYADLFREVEGELWEWIGRGMVVNAAADQEKSVPVGSPGSIFAGVVARSSGAWGNEKTVCACSGKTMWEEGREMERKGLL